MIGALFLDAGLWVVVIIFLIAGIWLFPQWKMIVFFCTLCIAGFLYSTSRLETLDLRRDTLGTRVGWDGFTHTIE